MSAGPGDAGEIGYNDELALHLATLLELWGSPAFRARLTGVVDPALGTTDSRVLWELAFRGPTRPGILSDAMGIGAPSISKATTRLTNRGLIEVMSDATDGRASLLRLTPPGRALARRLYEVGDELVEELTRDWSYTDRATITRLLARLVDSALELEHAESR